ncbi:hypothetical protein ACN469_03610 [Corallococcus terminator]
MDWPRKKRAYMARQWPSTRTKQESVLLAWPTATLPKLPQSTCASSPGSVVRRRKASAAGCGRVLRT